MKNSDVLRVRDYAFPQTSLGKWGSPSANGKRQHVVAYDSFRDYLEHIELAIESICRYELITT